jgi:hypothetical protein
MIDWRNFAENSACFSAVGRNQQCEMALKADCLPEPAYFGEILNQARNDRQEGGQVKNQINI